jgi:hypothetical protein
VKTEDVKDQQEHPMLDDRFWMFDEYVLEAEAAALKVNATFDLGSFEVVAAHREGTPVILIRNKREGELSALISRDPIGGDMPYAGTESGQR